MELFYFTPSVAYSTIYIRYARAATVLLHSAAPSEVGFQFLAAIRLIADSTPPLWKTHTRRLDFLTFSHHL